MESELQAHGYVIRLVVTNPNPPATTKIAYTRLHGSAPAAVAIAALLGLPRSVVGRYVNTGAPLPSRTNVVIFVGQSA